MLKIDINKNKNYVIATPCGKLTKEDFSNFAKDIDTYINENDEVPSLIIHADGFPHWDKFKSFVAHLKFIKEAQHIIPKVAIVSDNKALIVLPKITQHFVRAKVRHFPEMKMQQALKWVSTKGDHPGNVELLKGLPADVIAVRLEGVITAADYEETLIPMVSEKLKVHDKLKMLAVLDDSFQSYTAGAMWDDTKFGLTHLTTLSKLAVVSDRGWVRRSVKLFGPLMPTHVRVFYLSELEDAREWIKT